jgi:hypothetical protein
MMVVRGITTTAAARQVDRREAHTHLPLAPSPYGQGIGRRFRQAC